MLLVFLKELILLLEIFFVHFLLDFLLVPDLVENFHLKDFASFVETVYSNNISEGF
jgi:hypothetical protein